MRICPNCGHENPDQRDFCVSCNKYLRWELTGGSPVASLAETGVVAPDPEPDTEPEAARPPSSTQAYPLVQTPTQPPPGADAVILRVGAADGNGGAPTARADAGGEATLGASIRNQSGIVDNYELRVTGIPEGWWTIAPSTVYLVPLGAPGGNSPEQEIEVRFHPPRTPEAEARPWPIQIVARSRAHGVDVATADATLVIAPYYELETELRPERASGRRRAKYALQVRSRGNAAVEIEVAGVDSENECRFRFDEARFLAEPGRRAGTVFWVHPRRQSFVGKPADRRFQVLSQPVDVEASAPPRHGTLRQRPWLPWWILLALPLAVVAAAGAMALRTETVLVPDLTKASGPFEVSKLLREAGLVLGDRHEEEVDEWTRLVLEQSPAAGEEVEKGSEVTIKVAISREVTEVKVPNVVGKTLDEASRELQEAGLQLGMPGTPPTDPATSKIATQEPLAESLATKGSEVTPYFEGAPPDDGDPGATTGQTTTGQTTTGQTTTGEDDGPGRPKLVIPAVATLGVAGAVAALQKLGLDFELVQRFSADVPPKGLIAQQPAAGAEVDAGTKVKLVVSAGYPQLVFDAGGDVQRMRGGDGEALTGLASDPAEFEEQPAWSPTGALVAYRRGTAEAGQIWVVDPARPTSARPLTDAGFDDRRPAFSADGAVVAFVRGRPGADYDLCFQPVNEPPGPHCVPDPQTSVSRPAWSPGGRAILVVGQVAGEQQAELHEYYTSVPNSPRPSDWSSRGPVTATMHAAQPGAHVVAAAWSPDGTRVAFTANWGGDPTAFRLFLAPVNDDVLGEPEPVEGAAGCEVAWRSDGEELALTQREGCSASSGAVVRLAPDRPDEQVVLRKDGAANATWQPLELAD